MWKQNHNHSPKYFLLYSPDNGYVHKKNFHIPVGTPKSLFPNTSLCVVQYTVRTGKFFFPGARKEKLRTIFCSSMHYTTLFYCVSPKKQISIAQQQYPKKKKKMFC
jgi:hypothetical protein